MRIASAQRTGAARLENTSNLSETRPINACEKESARERERQRETEREEDVKGQTEQALCYLLLLRIREWIEVRFHHTGSAVNKSQANAKTDGIGITRSWRIACVLTLHVRVTLRVDLLQ